MYKIKPPVCITVEDVDCFISSLNFILNTC